MEIVGLSLGGVYQGMLIAGEIRHTRSEIELVTEKLQTKLADFT